MKTKIKKKNAAPTKTKRQKQKNITTQTYKKNSISDIIIPTAEQVFC